MTGRNANVFYETGYAHALGKRTILLTKNTEDIPFDFKHYPHIVYGSSIGKLREELFTKIQWAVSNVDAKVLDASTLLAFHMNGKELRNGTRIEIEYGRIATQEALASGITIPRALIVKVDIQNVSNQFFDASGVQIGLRVPAQVGAAVVGRDIIDIGPGTSLLMLGSLQQFNPLSWQSIQFGIPFKAIDSLNNIPQSVQLRLYSHSGNREIDFSLIFIRR
jgi:hypothetical protein